MYTSQLEGHHTTTLSCRIIIGVVILWSLLPVPASRAADPASNGISTDRPDFTESTEVVGPWMLQIEGGFTLARDSTGGTPIRSLGGPFPLLRLGLSRRLELRLATDGYVRESIREAGQSGRASGLSDLVVGAKLKLADEGRVRPALSIIPSLSLPTGSRQVTSSGYDPAINFAWGKSLPVDFDSGGNVKLLSVTSDGRRFLQRVLSVSFGHRLFTGIEGFWEAYEISPPDRDRAGLLIFDTGLTHVLGRNALIDLEIGRSVRPATPTWFVGAGLAFRAPLRSKARHDSDAQP